jgi:hypothetical protein
MSDRFTRDTRQAPRREDRELALRLREQMRTAVDNVRAGASDAGARALAEDREDGDRRFEPAPRHVDPHRLY